MIIKKIAEFVDNDKHIAVIKFNELSNEGYNNIINKIEEQCPDLISPDEEKFYYQKVVIDYDRNLLTFTSPNTYTNNSIGSPNTLTFKYKVRGDMVKDFLSKNYKDFKPEDFIEQLIPKFLNEFDDHQIVSKIKEQTKCLMALIMNCQPEPLW